MSQTLATIDQGIVGPVRCAQRLGWLLLGFALLSAVNITSNGCSYDRASPFGFANTWIEQPLTTWRDRVWARRAIAQHCGHGFVHAHRGDYQAGFAAGYRDICHGGDGQRPLLPPKQYWGTRYQTAEGSAKTDAWYEGYTAGAVAAEEQGVGSYVDFQMQHLLQSSIQQDPNQREQPSLDGDNAPPMPEDLPVPQPDPGIQPASAAGDAQTTQRPRALGNTLSMYQFSPGIER